VVVNDPAVVAEVRAAFDAYERDLLANDLDALDRWFWTDERVVRFLFGEIQAGAAAVSRSRRSVARQTPPRTLTHCTITTYGTDVATVFAVFALDATTQRVHQSQVWARLDGAWRVTAAHVS
jgi:hypothetical protein